MGEFITREEHNEYAKRMEDEHRRQNRRLELLEKAIEQNSKLLISVEKLAINMENMQIEQKDQGERLETLETRDGKMWRKVVAEIIKVVVCAIVGFAIAQIGM